jgi:8-oxo-dGTP pyrophosphatase MutT (NUDIX family)
VVAAGEDYPSAARRELVEEIGIGVDAVGPGLVTLDDGFPRPYDDTEVSLLGRCFQITSPGPFRFLDGEVAEAWWTGRDELTELLGREKFLPDSVRLLLPLIRW